MLIVSILILEVLTRGAFSFKFNDSNFYFHPMNFDGNDGVLLPYIENLF